ncbi:hypothetical protein RHGRI_026794 [Rhododendron griersonianum]|uniref:Uncharacterized protein n=1 Tax=Rhododendron griersonianum TaxID=479676 RepID=A0AAV6IU39_9ERIC|nr:hypothetical protein RHGRI_026794 [Rhododendron griersonianum]
MLGKACVYIDENKARRLRLRFDPGDDDSVDFDVNEALEDDISGDSRVELLDDKLTNKQNLSVDVELGGGNSDELALKKAGLLVGLVPEDAPSQALFLLRLKRSQRKIRKKKLITEFGLKAVNLKNKDKVVSSHDIRNRNSTLIMQAHKWMDTGALLGAKYNEDENFMLRISIEMEGKKTDKEVGDFDDVEEGASISLEL